MYRHLDGAEIVETVRRLASRIDERFPDSGLTTVCGDLLSAATESTARVARLRQPNLPLRAVSWALIAVLAVVGLEAVVHLPMGTRWSDVANFLQSTQAIQNVVFLGIAVLFLANVENRIRRRRTLDALHELRSIAHLVDMHQLRKDPDQYVAERVLTESSPHQTLTRFELSRYLGYCTEMLSLTSKVATLYVQDFQDPVVLEAVNDLENLTTGLSGKIWQKIMILDTRDVTRERR
jgi:hypothetical protein